MGDKILPIIFIAIIGFGLVKTCLPKKDGDKSSKSSNSAPKKTETASESAESTKTE